ncbi:dTDP-4-dehydrorhamnose 3,5-epimerase [Enterobacter quasiroggenkampii]|uniref:dTDP-4-dehydrorhamnose 3,5-epimerase n=1 Tax=Enterobacter quasiroggenkampii TaxID=2497436 RepID=UPI00064F07B5|nr:dTDP-4-dehydrorhamnose 3,5-epimerase [Enterobacter quasiroggenkampii]KML18780.1 dTDP-4-dehydrorhamnose 3,5-epimerase [Leclercia adecarboxylata]KMN60504.1 dTDP-4-dehydrorhamnose 3,5-epimerase [Leclercia sp. LK8]MCU6366787.1 dTDP-4-dehydrorhamnose 3,5-epimerase [Enterobacter quasiroggenkampii]
MNVTMTEIPDVLILEPKVFGDNRGFFLESFNQKTFNEILGREVNFVQDNHSKSAKNVLRGLHFQSQNTQGKLVRVTAGAVFDVAVDLRKNSESYGRWVGVELSADNKKQLWIPQGFAHGFYVLEENTEFVYKCTDYYNPAFEHSLAWNDESIRINWPLPEGISPIISEKDKKGLSLNECQLF